MSTYREYIIALPSPANLLGGKYVIVSYAKTTRAAVDRASKLCRQGRRGKVVFASSRKQVRTLALKQYGVEVAIGPKCATIHCHNEATCRIRYPRRKDDPSSFLGDIIERVCESCADSYARRPALNATIMKGLYSR